MLFRLNGNRIALYGAQTCVAVWLWLCVWLCAQFTLGGVLRMAEQMCVSLSLSLFNSYSCIQLVSTSLFRVCVCVWIQSKVHLAEGEGHVEVTKDMETSSHSRKRESHSSLA